MEKVEDLNLIKQKLKKHMVISQDADFLSFQEIKRGLQKRESIFTRVKKNILSAILKDMGASKTKKYIKVEDSVKKKQVRGYQGIKFFDAALKINQKVSIKKDGETNRSAQEWINLVTLYKENKSKYLGIQQFCDTQKIKKKTFEKHLYKK